MSAFPTRLPAGLLLGGLCALAVAPVVFTVWHRSQSPLESFYLPSYAKAYVQPSHGLLTGKLIPHSFYLVTVNGTFAVPETLPPDMRGVSGRFVDVLPSAYAAWLKPAIYHGKTPVEVLELPLLIWASSGMLLILAGGVYDFRRRRRAREGWQLRGPEHKTIRQFNRLTKARGKEKGFVLTTIRSEIRAAADAPQR
jgi:hypothetical protein